MVKKISQIIRKENYSSVKSYELTLNTVADLPCYNCKFILHKNYKFYVMKLLLIEEVKIALCFNCFNDWKKGKFKI